jgi:hypothetical protein
MFDGEERQRVYLLEERMGDDPHMKFVFTDKSALQGCACATSWRTAADCRKCAGDTGALDILAEQEKRAAMTFLEENFKDIRDNFDPSVVKFRKRRKTVLADGALDGLI